MEDEGGMERRRKGEGEERRELGMEGIKEGLMIERETHSSKRHLSFGIQRCHY